jgi:hypothetical protein
MYAESQRRVVNSEGHYHIMESSVAKEALCAHKVPVTYSAFGR